MVNPGYTHRGISFISRCGDQVAPRRDRNWRVIRENAAVPNEKEYPPKDHQWLTRPLVVSGTFADERKPEEPAREWLPAARYPPSSLFSPAQHRPSRSPARTRRPWQSTGSRTTLNRYRRRRAESISPTWRFPSSDSSPWLSFDRPSLSGS